MALSSLVVFLRVGRRARASLARVVVDRLPPVAAGALPSDEPREAARAAGVDARPLGLQRQVADQPVLVAVREHLAARVEADLVRDTARRAAPLPARHQRRRVLCDAVVDGEHGARRPSGVVVALILDGARDAVADAEAARRRLLGGLLRQAEEREPERARPLPEANLRAADVVHVLWDRNEAAVGRVHLDHVRQLSLARDVIRVVLEHRHHRAGRPPPLAAHVADDAIEHGVAQLGRRRWWVESIQRSSHELPRLSGYVRHVLVVERVAVLFCDGGKDLVRDVIEHILIVAPGKPLVRIVVRYGLGNRILDAASQALACHECAMSGAALGGT
mmetsp:Transcript_8461/g.27322  ORF Transcript_8461/g.27322 Transcript_8461/m.27322 type:complete len:333 (+) Transcript_8461:353-1351(+)